MPEWRERAAALGLDAAAVRELVGRARRVRLDRGEVDELLDRLGGPDGLTTERSTFTRRDVLQALCERAARRRRRRDRRAGADRRPVPRGRSASSCSPTASRGASSTTFDGRAWSRTVPTERRYSTPELLERERRVLDYATSAAVRGAASVAKRAVERALQRRPTIADEQAAMVRRLVLDGDGVAVVVGQAGTGKTFALAAAREAWEGSGYRVVGAALARRAAHRARGRRRDREHEHRGAARRAAAAAVDARCRGGRCW